MQSNVSATFERLECRSGVCIADGYGVQVKIRNKHLVVSDGIGHYRRERSFPRTGHNLKRLIVLGHEGLISFEALRWLSDIGVSFIHIDRDGEILTTSGRLGRDEPKLRRAQALSTSGTTARDAARYLLGTKIKGQLANLIEAGLSAKAIDQVKAALERAEATESFEEILRAEPMAAAAYWMAWQELPIRFGKRDLARLPESWSTFGTRSSALTGSPRLATNPANAILNYLYSLVEAEARIAALACGLDPGLGFFHKDQSARDSLALDLMEAVRPSVDRYLLQMLKERTFRAADFCETRKGVCRVLAPLSHELAETTTAWAKLLGPVCEQVVKLLGGARNAGGKVASTPLTQANRSAGRDAVRKRPKPQSQLALPNVVSACRMCGVVLECSDRLYCDDCLPTVSEERLSKFTERGMATLAKLRAEGNDPAHTEEARAAVGLTNARRQRELAAWEAANEKPAEETYRREILPLVEKATIPQLMKVTGLSVTYCADIRKGRVPHPRHWEAIANIVR